MSEWLSYLYAWYKNAKNTKNTIWITCSLHAYMDILSIGDTIYSKYSNNGVQYIIFLSMPSYQLSTDFPNAFILHWCCSLVAKMWHWLLCDIQVIWFHFDVLSRHKKCQHQIFGSVCFNFMEVLMNIFHWTVINY